MGGRCWRWFCWPRSAMPSISERYARRACDLTSTLQFGFFAEFRDGKGAGASAERERLQIALARAKRGAADTADIALTPLTGSVYGDSSARQ